MVTITSKDCFGWLLDQADPRDIPEVKKCKSLLRSRTKWEPRRKRAEKRLVALGVKYGWKGKPGDWAGFLAWLKTIDWEKVMKIIMAIIAMFGGL